jgi:hypothetical protein
LICIIVRCPVSGPQLRECKFSRRASLYAINVAGSAGRAGGELFDHRQQQLAVAVVEVGGVAADLGEEAELFVGDFLGVEMADDR